jgi:hypothetical protein
VIVIERHDDEKFKMKLTAPGTGWRPFSVVAENLAECHAAIDHYHAQPHDKSGCPLCRRDKS